MKNCWTCKYWEPYDLAESNPEESLGECNFPIVLPFSMRYCGREKVGTYGDQGENCNTYSERETN